MWRVLRYLKKGEVRGISNKETENKKDYEEKKTGKGSEEPVKSSRFYCEAFTSRQAERS